MLNQFFMCVHTDLNVPSVIILTLESRVSWPAFLARESIPAGKAVFSRKSLQTRQSVVTFSSSGAVKTGPSVSAGDTVITSSSGTSVQTVESRVTG